MRKRSMDPAKILPSDITPYERYLSRRAVLAGVCHEVGGAAVGVPTQCPTPVDQGVAGKIYWRGCVGDGQSPHGVVCEDGVCVVA